MFNKKDVEMTERDIMMMSFGYGLAGADKLMRFQGRNPSDPKFKEFRKHVAAAIARRHRNTIREVL